MPEPEPPHLGLAEPQAPPTNRQHLEWLDLFRGVAILGVIVIHALSRFLREARPGSAPWYGLAVVHEAAHFAVPGFLLLSAMVNTASLLRRSSLRGYFLSRAQTVLWPYLLWSVIYLAYTHTQHAFRWRDAPAMVLWGRGYFHLYFLWVLLQLLLLLPLLVRLVRRQPPFAPVALAAVVLTLGVYAANRYAVHNPNFSRSVFWYVPVVALGLWLGSPLALLSQRLRRAAPWAAALTVAGFALYAPLSIQAQRGQPVNTFLYQVGEWIYSSSASLLLLALCSRWSGTGPLTRLMDAVGRWSLPIYLVHPLVLRLMDFGPRYTRAAGLYPSALLYIVCGALLPALLAAATDRLRLSPFLFGRLTGSRPR